MNRRHVVGSVLLLAALAAGHVAYWYVPRVHAGVPRSGYLPAELLVHEDFAFAVWIPRPHQNLSALAGAVADDGAAVSAEDLTRALSRLAGLPEASLPRFGALEIPPATELTFAADEGGDRFALAAEVYPSAAAFAKLAGRLTGNPWLRGGTLILDGRRVEVAWHGRVWTVASPGLPAFTAAAPFPDDGPCLAIAEVRRAVPPLPASRLVLTRQGRDLVLAPPGAGPGHPDLAGFDPATLGLFMVVATGPGDATGEPTQAMAFFPSGRDRRARSGPASYELPGIASIYETGGERWSLPGESLLALGGHKVRRKRLGHFTVAALDGPSFRRAQELMPRLAPLARPRPDGQLAWGLWFDLESGLGEVTRLADALDGNPIVPRRHRRRWRDAATVLAPVSRSFSRLTVVVSNEPPVLRLRLVAREP